jgi:hypothetical protein
MPKKAYGRTPSPIWRVARCRSDARQEGAQSIRFDGANEGEGDFYHIHFATSTTIALTGMPDGREAKAAKLDGAMR